MKSMVLYFFRGSEVTSYMTFWQTQAAWISLLMSTLVPSENLPLKKVHVHRCVLLYAKNTHFTLYKEDISLMKTFSLVLVV